MKPSTLNNRQFPKLWLLLELVLLVYLTPAGISGQSAGVMYMAECPAQELILPCRCLTRGDEYQIWCSHSELSRVQDGLKSIGKLITNPIDELILENNNLPSLPGRFFIPVRAMRLMLRNNNLQRVSSGWLTGLEESLMELFIVEPELRSLPVDSLDQLHKLEAVTIKSGLMKRAPYFSGLQRLRYVQIESTSLIELSPRAFKMLPSLEKLHITGSDHLLRLEANLLQDLPRLNLVNISYNAVNWVHPRSFSRLPSLTDLHLIGNQITDAGMIGRGLRDLQALSVLKLDFNNIDKLSEASFVDLPALRELTLSYNQIAELHHGAFHRVPMLRTLNLNHNLVRRVHPESFLQHSGSGLEELWLIDNDINHISEVRSLLDALPRLSFLDMSYNYVEDIPFGALRGHPTLERLHLDHNKIQMVEREAFTAMPALRELRLRNNSLSNLLDGPLWNLPALKGLDLSENYFKRIEPRMLANLPSLRRVDISANQVSVVDPATFLETPALEHVNISHNILSSLHPATFRHLLSLYEVDVNHNRLVEFVPGLPRGVEFLHMARNHITSLPLPPSPDLDLPSLRMLDLSANGIHRIPPGGMRSLPQLRRLNLGRNTIQTLENGCLEGLTRLEILDLQENRLMVLHPHCLRDKRELRELNLKGNRIEMLVPEILQDSQRLKKLDVSKNRLTDIMSGTFQNTRELQNFDASYNSLSQLPPSIRGLKNLQVLDLTNNLLKYLQPETLSSLSSLAELRISRNRIQELRAQAFHNLPNLNKLDLQENELESMEPFTVRSLPNLKSLRLGKNRLRTLPENVFNDLPALETAELQENQLQNIAETAFSNVPHLLMLNLSSNQLPGLEQAGVRTLRSLEVLDLSNNKVLKIDSNTMAKMEWLVELKMDNNKICAIQGSPFNGMPRLRVLSLRNNRMTTLPEQAVKRLRSNIAVLDIDGNPISCTCSMLWMRAWLQEASEMGPRCSDGSLLREVRLSRQECSEQNVAKYNDPISPGCEAEMLDPKLYGTSQVFSPYMNIKEHTSPLSPSVNTMAPSPEESDYFYDDYVDYPYNESNIIAAEQNNSLYNDKLAQMSSTLKPGSGMSSHFIPGDTPTLYAEPKPSNQNDTGMPNKHMSPNSSGFTFFGMPLPALNLGSFWSSGRKADRKNGLSHPRGNGRVQMFPSNRPGSFSPPQDQNVPSTRPQPPPLNQPPAHTFSGRFPPTDPEVQTGGFVPMLPGSGGFTPILNPVTSENVQNRTKISGPKKNATAPNRTESTLSQLDHDEFLGSETVNASDNKISKRGPHFLANPTHSNISQETSRTKIPPPNVFKNNKVTITKLESKPPISHNHNQKHSSTEPPVKHTTEKSFIEPSTKRVLISPSTSTSPTFMPNETKFFKNPFNTDDSVPTSAPKLPKIPKFTEFSDEDFESQPNIINETKLNTTSEEISPEGIAQENTTRGSSQVGDLWGSISGGLNQKENIKPTSNETPSPLSALLVPGGQQPPYRPPIGKPTITKVEAPHMEGHTNNKSVGSEVERLPFDDFLTESFRESKAGSSSNEITTIKIPPHDSSMSWYFKNYNQSSLEPYIGPGSETRKLSVSNSAAKISPYNNFPIIYVVLFKFAIHLK